MSSKTQETELPEKFNFFSADISGIELPEKFTFPFCYEPHELAKIASKELQEQVIEPTQWQHNFGLAPNNTDKAVGKMFGVLVVQSAEGQVGYLAAYSGILTGVHNHPNFVPLLYNRFKQDDFFKQGSKVLDQFHIDIEKVETNSKYLALKRQLIEAKQASETEIAELRAENIAAKKLRKQRRTECKTTLDAHAYEVLDKELQRESIGRKYHLKDTITKWNATVKELSDKVAVYENEIKRLREARRQQSAHMQNQLFDAYQFLNVHGETKSLRPIFKQTPLQIPPAGAGDCAAPKLLQYAFANNLKPICLAEFWWGVSSAADIRHHKQYYPACKGKCEPILGHMLQGTELEPNPLLKTYGGEKGLDVIYSDEHMAIINKPPELLSVPGKELTDSVYTRFKEEFPSAEGPIIVHRLDMSTSGIMVLAMHKEAHQQLQKQFIERTITKRYTALLDGFIKENAGEITLPLMVDYINRPLQKVDYQEGKKAHTTFKVVNRTADSTLVHFFPITGRTHQLRVHAAHAKGLNAPIVGDDLYGKKNSRLHLHAGYLQLKHPVTGKKMKFTRKADFE